MTTTSFDIVVSDNPKSTHILVCRTKGLAHRMVLLSRGSFTKDSTSIGCALCLLAYFLGLDDSASVVDILPKFEEFVNSNQDIDEDTYYLMVGKEIYWVNFPIGVIVHVPLSEGI